MEFDRVSLFGDKISIRIPHEWEEVDSDDIETVTFYDQVDKLGWLRVSLFTKQTEESFQDVDLKNLIDSAHDGDCGFYKVGDVYVAAWDEETKSDSSIMMFYWEAGAIINSKLMRMAIFSLTVEKERMNKDGFDDEIAMIQDCIFATHFVRSVQ
jgi:hypothetical protein